MSAIESQSPSTVAKSPRNMSVPAISAAASGAGTPVNPSTPRAMPSVGVALKKIEEELPPEPKPAYAAAVDDRVSFLARFRASTDCFILP